MQNSSGLFAPLERKTKQHGSPTGAFACGAKLAPFMLRVTCIFRVLGTLCILEIAVAGQEEETAGFSISLSDTGRTAELEATKHAHASSAACRLMLG